VIYATGHISPYMNMHHIGLVNLARRGEIATKTQEPRPISNCKTLPSHVCVLLLAHPLRSASDVCDGGVVRTDRHGAGERSGSTQ
jgi:hypothetical protein